MYNLDDCIGFITNKGAKILSDEFNRRLQEHDMTRVQWIALYYIGKTNGIFQKELSDYMSVKESSMVRLIDRMEKDDLVERRKEIKDRRVTRIFLSDKGKKLREELIPLGEEFQRDAVNGIQEDELNIFKNVLEKMINNVCKY
ncbi:MarR family winged helix-turn-helix transcriptional regulator [Clostridium sp. M14]|uniref:MarR family winged helix-turn-helix transcriptional regulator n=1 Tax=Clostridium sp. M14 TaxID=2716311 RepID=UPI0013EEE3D5|nr:MarR family transcriptional regulator [Clostridium sp. M14]MBZ9693021.1 MarR family transcriptional regulator [Clostridium sp. M14]